MGKRVAEKAAVLDGAFGFDPDESPSHFLVHVPTGNQHAVEISEHLSWDAEKVSVSQHYGEAQPDGQVRCRLARSKWNELADAVRAEFNGRLKRQGKQPGRWVVGFNPVSRALGKELTLLAWAVEDADPALVRHAVANWLGLAPEERWWLYTMTAAATGHVTTGRSIGWRKAVRYALTENPVTNRVSDHRVVPEFFRLAVAGQETIFDQPQPRLGHASVEPPLTPAVDPVPESLLPIPLDAVATTRPARPKRSRAKKASA